MQHYGLILADNGSALYVTGVSDSRWGSDLDSLKTVPATAFEVVQMRPVYDGANYPTGAAPNITSFSASASHVVSVWNCDSILGCDQRRLRDRFARARCRAAYQRDGQSHGRYDLYALCNQSIWPIHCNGYGERSVVSVSSGR